MANNPSLSAPWSGESCRFWHDRVAQLAHRRRPELAIRCRAPGDGGLRQLTPFGSSWVMKCRLGSGVDTEGRMPSRYRVTFRIRHPSMDPRDITAVLGRDPVHSGKAGDPRRTPKGRPLGGTNRETYWYVRIAEGNSPPRSLAAALDDALNELAEHRIFVQRVRAEGGRSEFFVCWFFQSQAGETFEHSTLAKMADLGIDLTLDNYHEEQPDEKPDPAE
jgi:hypothetical protein